MVSVVIPCYNHANFVGQAIESVLGQTYSNFELIVVDDGSTDNSADVARRYPAAQYIYQQNAGPSVARNTGLRQSRGEYIVFLDADDRLLAHALETGVRHLSEHPECAFVSGHCRVIDSNGAILPSPRQLRVEHEHYLRLLRGGNYIWCPATVFYRRQILDLVHGFDVAHRSAADYELYLRVTRDFPVYSHDEVIAEYRHHSSNMSRDLSVMQKDALAALEAEWTVTGANTGVREAYTAGRRFWEEEYPVQHMIRRIREIVREHLPSDAIVAVATSGDAQLLQLDGRQTWNFPQVARQGPGDLFAKGAEGSMPTGAWIEAGTTYIFSLYGGRDCSELMARTEVRGVVELDREGNEESIQQKHGDGALLTAIPNPVPAGDRSGATTIRWNTGDGSLGCIYVRRVGEYAGHDPKDSDEARASLESARNQGAQYLLLPATSFYWRDEHAAFRSQMNAAYSVFMREEDTCIIFDLRQPLNDEPLS